jgi:hypothetical protein
MSDFRDNYTKKDFRDEYKKPDDDFRNKYNNNETVYERLARPSDPANGAAGGEERSPILSSEYIGIGSSKWTCGSLLIKMSTNTWRESNQVHSSTEIFKCSDDILKYLKEHPDFQRAPPSQLQAICAAIMSGLALAGGIVLAVLTAGADTPAVLVFAASLVISMGATGLTTAISERKDFSWARWATEVAISGGVTLITFGAGYAAGSCTGLALFGSRHLSELSIKAVGTAAGALAGAGARTGCYLVIVKVRGKPVEVLKMVVEAVSGALTGAQAGFLGVKSTLISCAENLSPAEIEKSLNGALANVPPEDVSSYTALFEQRQTIVEVITHKVDGIGRVALIEGWHAGDHSGAGLLHMLQQHRDVFEALRFSVADVNAAIASPGSQVFNRIAERFVDMVKSAPYGSTGVGDPVWQVGEKFIKVGLSDRLWGLGSRVAVQANIVSRGDVWAELAPKNGLLGFNKLENLFCGKYFNL